MSVFQGVDHVGIGVSDIDAAIEFYGRGVGFDRVLFDWTGELGGLEAVWAGRRGYASQCSRTAAPRRSVPGASSSCRCSTTKGRHPCRRVRPGARSECVRSVSTSAASARYTRASSLRAARSSCRQSSAAVVPNDVDLDISYVADPWGTKLELIEWTGLWRSLPGPARAEGVNHVAFGVTDMPRTRAFYERLGFTELLFESFEFFDPMAPWYTKPWYDPASLPAQHMTMPMPDAGRVDRAGCPRPSRSRLPGHVGASGPDGLRDPRHEHRPRRLGAACRRGRGYTASRSRVDLGGGREWRYLSFAEPDGNYVSLLEARY